MAAEKGATAARVEPSLSRSRVESERTGSGDCSFLRMCVDIELTSANISQGVMKYYAVDKVRSCRRTTAHRLMPLRQSRRSSKAPSRSETPHADQVRSSLPSPLTASVAAGATGKKYNSAFQVQTAKRTYFMITESLEDMVLWQRVCRLRQARASRHTGPRPSRRQLEHSDCRRESSPSPGPSLEIVCLC